MVFRRPPSGPAAPSSIPGVAAHVGGAEAAERRHRGIHQPKRRPQRPRPGRGADRPGRRPDPTRRRRRVLPDGALLVTGLDCLAIGGVACAHDITLYELGASRASLEQAFFELTRDATDYRAGELAGATQGA